VLSHKDPTRHIEGESFAVTNPGGKAFRWREPLIDAVGVVFPDAGTCLELRAWTYARRVECPILDLAGIRSGTEIDVEIVCIGWSPLSGSPETITSGDEVGTIDPGGSA
jgi:hypothetical protein